MNEVKEAGLLPTGVSGRIEMRTPNEVSAMLALVTRRKSLDGIEDWVAGRFRQYAGQRRCRAPGARRGEGCRGEPAHGGAGGGASATGVASGSAGDGTV